MKNEFKNKYKVILKSILPVEVDIDNEAYFASIVPFLDRYETLELILNIRKNLGIKKLIPSENFDEWFNNDESHKKNSRLFFDWTMHQPDAFLEKCGRPDIWSIVIVKAAVCQKINTNDCNYCYTDIVYPSGSSNGFSRPQLAILFTPNTKLEEITEAFRQSKSKFNEYSILTRSHNFSNIHKTIKTNTSIKILKQQREFFWKYIKSDSGYSKIKIADCESNNSRYRSYQRRIKSSVFVF